MTKVELELLTDENMLLMFEEGIRGGICQGKHHYETPNNKYMKNYNKDIISSFLMYLDKNNFYGWALIKTLPIGKFKWTKKTSIYTEEAIKMYNENGEHGEILEVYVEYPPMMHVKHKDFHFLPERSIVNGVKKLVTTAHDKER